jgi:hypothetical protein
MLLVIGGYALVGFIAGWLLGFATGHFVTALVPGFVFSVIFVTLGLLFRRV